MQEERKRDFVGMSFFFEIHARLSSQVTPFVGQQHVWELVFL